jgi:hypothetical protein
MTTFFTASNFAVSKFTALKLRRRRAAQARARA